MQLKFPDKLLCKLYFSRSTTSTISILSSTTPMVEQSQNIFRIYWLLSFPEFISASVLDIVSQFHFTSLNLVHSFRPSTISRIEKQDWLIGLSKVSGGELYTVCQILCLSSHKGKLSRGWIITDSHPGDLVSSP